MFKFGVGLAIAAGILSVVSGANAGFITTHASGSTSGVGGYVWAYSEAGGRFAYSAAIAECSFNGNCGASSQSISYNEYEVRFSPTPEYEAANTQAGGLLVNMTYILSASGQATASIQWGGIKASIGPSFGSLSQFSETTQILMASDGSTGDYLTIIKLSSSANAGANGINNPGPVISVAYADPIFEPINAGSYGGAWSFDENLNTPGTEEHGTQDTNIDLPIDLPQVPVPAGIVLLASGLALAHGIKWRSTKY